MVKLYDFAKKTELRQHVLKNIEYTKNLTDDQLRIELNNERLGLKYDNESLFYRLLELGDPLISKVDDYLADIDEHCGPSATSWQMDIPHYGWLQKIKNRSMTQKEYEGIMNGKEPIMEYTTVVYPDGKPKKAQAKEYLK